MGLELISRPRWEVPSGALALAIVSLLCLVWNNRLVIAFVWEGWEINAQFRSRMLFQDLTMNQSWPNTEKEGKELTFSWNLLSLYMGQPYSSLARLRAWTRDCSVIIVPLTVPSQPFFCISRTKILLTALLQWILWEHQVCEYTFTNSTNCLLFKLLLCLFWGPFAPTIENNDTKFEGCFLMVGSGKGIWSNRSRNIC